MNARNHLIAGRRAWSLTGLAACLGLFVSCASDTVRQGSSPVYLTIDSLSAASGASPDTFGNVLESDVLTQGSVFEDPGRAQMRIVLKDLGSPGTTTGPSLTNQVTITRYRVTFRRSDGRETPGTDVPYGFDGGVTATITDSGTTFDFTLVRAQAKIEAPLKQLTGGGGAKVISTLAEVTFYGRDGAGNEVTGTGLISVNFADWADPDTGSDNGDNGGDGSGDGQ
jgi:hypothetical protein